MKKVSILLMLLIGGLFMTSCEDGEDGIDGIDGIDGVDGRDGQDGADGQDGQDGADGQDGQDATTPPQGNTPVGFVETIWNNFEMEDRRANTNPGDIGVGNARLIRDENNHFFFELSGFNTDDPIGTTYNVYNTVAGAALDTQNGFAEDERPRLVMNLEGTAPFTITNGNERIFIPLTTPPGPAASGRNFDWIVIYPESTTDFTIPGIVADLDATDLLPRRQIWNAFEIEDRTAGSGVPATTNNGSARLITNDDQGRTRFWVQLDENFQNVGAPINRGNGSIIAERFAVFVAVAGAPLGTQVGFDQSERPVFVGFVEANGAQYVPIQDLGTADLEAIDPNEIISGMDSNGDFRLNNGNVSLNADNYVIPQRATGGLQRWYDWVILHPVDAANGNIRPVGYGGLASDLDRDNELSQNQTSIEEENVTLN